MFALTIGMEMQNYSKENAVQALKKLINDWIQEKPARNPVTIARLSGASENCIRRVLNNNSLPNPENIQKILSFLKSGQNQGQILNSVPSDLASHLKFNLSYLNFEEVQEYTPLGELEKHLKDYVHQAIFERSSMGSGFPLTQVEETFGKYGTQVAGYLSDAGMVTIENGTVKCKKELWNHSSSTTLTKRFLSNSVDQFYKTESQVNFIFTANDCVSKKGYAQIMDIMELAQKSIISSMKNEPGELPVCLGGFMDTMSKDNLFSNNSEEST